MTQGDIAVVGLGCRFPGAKNAETFWDLLISGRDAVTEVPEDRWSKSFYFHPRRGQSGKSYTWAAGVIDHIDRFDADFFGISPREARQMDPQQRLLLEVAWEALEDGGLRAADLAGSGTGVYVGVSGMDYATLRLGDPAGADAYFMTGITNSIVANRLSYALDLHGPSFAVDTACSSSLVALHQACEALRRGEVPLAIVGGVNLLLAPFAFVGFSQAAMLSPLGRCHAFDARADGYVRAEGAGAVILKPLAKALADGDRIRAVIRGTGVNSDGHTMGLSLPNEASQSALLREVYARAEMQPETLSFMEAHGTGTPAGDPIELTALGNSLAQHRTTPLPVGSVKTNVGHLETASGMAGLIKTILALEHRTLPASLHFETPNPHIDFEQLNVEVVTAARALPASGTLLAGINSFGFGGTNAHAIVASAPPVPAWSAKTADALPALLLSARSKAALTVLAQDWSQRLQATTRPEAARLLRGAARRRDHHRHRLYSHAADPAQLSRSLAANTEGNATVAGDFATGLAAASGRMAFVYSGNGAQFFGMARDALDYSESFRSMLARVDAALNPFLGWSVAARLLDDDPDCLRRTDIAQPLLFAVQVCITEALRAQGVEPEVCLGHSVGEIAAAWAAGALSLETACRIVVSRSQQQHRTEGTGGMAAISFDADILDEITAMAPGLEIAALNSRSNITVAGDKAALANLESVAMEKGWRYTGLDLNYAFHSAKLDLVRQDLLAELGAIESRPGDAKFISTVTGGALSGVSLDADYWWKNIRRPVRFRDAVRAALGQGIRILLEIGPNPILQSYLRDGLREAECDGRVLATLSRRPADHDPFSGIAAKCYVAGHDLSAHAGFDGPCDIAGLPRYPWQRELHWTPLTTEAQPITKPVHDHPLLGFRRDTAHQEWTQTLDLALQPWLADHAVEGVAILPAAAMLEIALAVARHAAPQAAALVLTELEIRQALALEADRPRSLRVRLDQQHGVTIESRTRLGEENWVLHATARLAPDLDSRAQPVPDAAITDSIDAATLYARATALGLDYGPQFRTVSRVEILDDGSARARLQDAGDAVFAGFLLPPPLVDGGLQAFLALLAGAVTEKSEWTLLPWRFTGVRLFAPYGRMPSQARLTITHRGTRSACGTLVFLDDAENVIADIVECWFHRVRLSQRQSVADRAFHFALAAKPLAADDIAPFMDPAILIGAENIPATGGDTALLLEAFVAAAAQQALLAILPPETPFAIDALVTSGVIAPVAAPLLANTLELLAGHGGAVRQHWQWQLNKDSELPAPALIWRTILDENPALVAELALAAAAAESLPAFLEHGTPERLPPALTEQMACGSPAGRHVMTALGNAVQALAASWPKNRPLRILEVGAGAGTLSRQLLHDLESWDGTFCYVATDSDAAQIARLSNRLKNIPGASAQVWNPCDGDAAALGSRFDLVLSCHAFSRLALDDAAFANLRDTLVPGGVVLAAEPQPGALWNWIFGQQPHWWRHSIAAEFPISPLRDAQGWKDQLARAGFEPAAARSLEDGGWTSSLIAARCTPGAQILETTPAGPVTILVAEKSDPLAGLLAKKLLAAGGEVHVFAPPDMGDNHNFREAFHGLADGMLNVVLLPLAQPAGDLVTVTSIGVMRVLTAARLTAALRERVRLCIVTQDAQQSAPGTPAMSEDAALWGLGRTLANEAPQLACRLIDLSSLLPTEDRARALAGELLAPDGESEIVIGPAGRQVLRLQRGFAARAAASGPVRLVAKTPGRLDSLQWEPQDLTAPGSGQVAIRVRAVDVNFRDVMWALDMLPEEALLGGYGGPTLGLACAGVVRAVGAGVENVKPGDPVLAIAPATFASDVMAAAHTVTRLPANLDFAAAATIPVAFVTVLYALEHLAHLRRGERVLIHGAAGGVGIAAIQYAQHVGAQIIATAGSPAKRAFLHQLGVEHVLDSRDLSFVDAVKTLTGGRGVDVVLNSLSGDAMEQSMGLLRPFGRFLELGKRDFFTGTRVGLKPLRRNISYFAVDVDALPVERPELSSALMQQIIALIEKGALRPLPYRVFEQADVADAFRLMQAAGHIGKIIVEMKEEQPARKPAMPAFAVRGDGTYLVTGGLAGFGLATAEWLAERGAGALALLGRRGAATPGAADALARLRENGVDVRAFACDVADGEALAAVLADIRRDMPSLRGVFHAAMELDDGLLADLDLERTAKVLQPKLGGAWQLDRLTRNDALEHFVLYSSATTALGAPGQGSYVAANFALEGLARKRRAAGLPAFVIGWGPIADAGYLARHTDQRDMLERRLSATPMPAAEALNALPALMSGGELSVIFAAVRWDAAQRVLPILSSPAFAGLVGARRDGVESDLRARLTSLPPEQCRELLLSVLREEVMRILASSSETLDPHRPVSELGMDSLMAVELRLALEARIGVSLPMFSLSQDTSLVMIAARLARDLASPQTKNDPVRAAAERYETAALLKAESQATNPDTRTATSQPER